MTDKRTRVRVIWLAEKVMDQMPYVLLGRFGPSQAYTRSRAGRLEPAGVSQMLNLKHERIKPKPITIRIIETR